MLVPLKLSESSLSKPTLNSQVETWSEDHSSIELLFNCELFCIDWFTMDWMFFEETEVIDEIEPELLLWWGVFILDIVFSSESILVSNPVDFDTLGVGDLEV